MALSAVLSDKLTELPPFLFPIGSPAILTVGSLALRPCLTAGLPFSWASPEITRLAGFSSRNFLGMSP
jgi:hypothetical protein